MREIVSANGSRYLLCELALEDRRFPKYPPQPIVQCDGFTVSRDRVEEQWLNAALELLPNTFAVCRLRADAPIPKFSSGEFVSITRTTDELSIVCRQKDIPKGADAERGWRCLRVSGKLDFGVVGLIAALTRVLANADISVFVVSTFETDYLLVKESDVARAVKALTAAEYLVRS